MKTVQCRLAKRGVFRIAARRVGRKKGVPGLEFEELLVGTAGPPASVVIAGEATVFAVNRTGEPDVDNVASQYALKLLDRNHRPKCDLVPRILGSVTREFRPN